MSRKQKKTQPPMLDKRGLDERRLVLIQSKFSRNKYEFGTGYFITNELVLTAYHVFSPGRPQEIKVRPEKSTSKHKWIHANPKPVWENQKLDAALIKVPDSGLSNVEHPKWGETDPDKRTDTRVEWFTSAYPAAYKKDNKWVKANLSGGLDVTSGTGQVAHELHLGVSHEPKEVEGWRGASGAPVFVDDEMIGIIRSGLPEIPSMLIGMPIQQLLQNEGFEKEIRAPQTKEPSIMWFLLLVSESTRAAHDKKKADSKKEDSLLEKIVRTGITNDAESIRRASGEENIDNELKVKHITEALETPNSWLKLVQQICAAPVMIVDVTQFEPAVMLALGIRAVVRRGVTITLTNEPINPEQLSKFPFNIQETKLISLHKGEGYNFIERARRTTQAIKDGLRQVKSHPGYLDLPAYNGVRSPKPRSEDGTQPGLDAPLSPENSVLVLCSFGEDYTDLWNSDIEGIISNEASPKRPARMLDLTSPRLVGQALYEHIRWTDCCIVDWTGWSANVFFEFGVRLACKDIGPICLIEKSKLDEINATCIGDASLSGTQAAPTSPESDGAGTKPSLLQRQQLNTLFRPICYELDGDGKIKPYTIKDEEPFIIAFERFENRDEENKTIPKTALAHDATYKAAIDAYDWEQEPYTQFPHEEMREILERQFGRDFQSEPIEDHILFSSNQHFKEQLILNHRERWIAVWYYFQNRFLPKVFNYVDLVSWNELPEERRNELKTMLALLDRDTRVMLDDLLTEVIDVLDASSDTDHEKIADELKLLEDLIEAAKNENHVESQERPSP